MKGGGGCRNHFASWHVLVGTLFINQSNWSFLHSLQRRCDSTMLRFYRPFCFFGYVLLFDHSSRGMYLLSCFVGELWFTLLPDCMDPLGVSSIFKPHHMSQSSSSWLHSYSPPLRFFITLHSSSHEWESAFLLSLKNGCFLSHKTLQKSLLESLWKLCHN